MAQKRMNIYLVTNDWNMHEKSLFKKKHLMVVWYRSADTLFWQVSVEHNVDAQKHMFVVNLPLLGCCRVTSHIDLHEGGVQTDLWKETSNQNFYLP